MSQEPSGPVTLPATSYALLGLLTFGDELTGYELKRRADNTLRFYWVAPAMSQIYSELTRMTNRGLVEGRVGFPVLKHTVLLRLLIGHVGEPERIRAMLEEYVAELTVARDDLR